MPVSRNLSLPSSLEGGKFKKRPGELHDLKHCLFAASNNQNSNRNNNQYKHNGVENDDVTTETSNAVESPATQQSPPLRSRFNKTSMNRGSLSHPCLSDNSKVGATFIFPHLFLGSQQDVIDEVMMTENNISNVLNVSCTCERPRHLDDEHFHRIAVRDNYQEKITPFLDEAVQFIESARKKHERVLVHCLAGVSRSATIAIAYVMYYLGLNCDDAYRFVKDRRPTISPNFNFLGQLMEYEKRLSDRGHMTKPRIGNFPSPDEVNHNVSGSTKATPIFSSKNLQHREVPFNTCFEASDSAESSSFALSTEEKRIKKTGNLTLNYHNPRDNGGAGVLLDLNPPRLYSNLSAACQLDIDGVERERKAELDNLRSFSSDVSTSSSSTTSDTRFQLAKVHENVPFDMCVPEQKTLNLTSIEVDGNSDSNKIPQDIEMREVESSSDLAPLSPTETPAYVLYRGQNYERSPRLSPKPDRMSLKSRSPKIVRKSWRPPYDCYAFRSLKSCPGSSVDTVSFRSLGPTSTNEKKSSTANHCASPSVGLSTLTLNSPAVMLYDESFTSSDSTSAAPSSASSTTLGSSNCKIGTSEPFRLIGSSELKPKWRKRKNSDNESSIRSVSTPVNSTSVLNRQNSINNIVTCS